MQENYVNKDQTVDVICRTQWSRTVELTSIELGHQRLEQGGRMIKTTKDHCSFLQVAGTTCLEEIT
jgi:hypothetical protein